jgi:hypothetical protein
MSDFSNNNNVAQPARTNFNREVVTQKNLLRWLAQGKIFEAGVGVEDTASDSQAALDDTKATYALQSPSSSSILVIPLLLKLMMIADGGALTAIDVAFTKPAGLCATPLTLSGRAMTSIHCMYQASPALASPSASALYGVATTFQLTASALVAADYVLYDHRHIIDAAITTGLPVLGSGPTNVQTWNFMNDGSPHILTSGAAMLVYINTGTTDSTFQPYMQWAEVTLDDLR